MRWEESTKEWWKWMHQAHCFGGVKWKGLTCIQNPLDLWMLAQLAFEAQAQTIVEIGSASGGTAAFLADSLMPYGHVITLDRNPCDVVHPRVHAWQGDAYTAQSVDHIQRRYHPSIRMMVIDDASHDPKDVAKGLELFHPLVAVSSFFVVMDTIVDTGILPHPIPEPTLTSVIDGFLKEHPNFQREESRYGISNCIGGILRRTA